jgi:hypothetical protein
MLNHIAAHVDVAEARITKEFESAITHEKEPFLKEIIEATRNGKPLETKYTASDILTILERLQESLPTID